MTTVNLLFIFHFGFSPFPYIYNYFDNKAVVHFAQKVRVKECRTNIWSRKPRKVIKDLIS